ncbi:MAG: phosphoglycerate kinase [Candidatus Aenigmatarchaeota archaeon]|nr:MAG: phosphoglycerate kinase [Candidatus Aenigmarchaeota archaeon]
MVYDFPFLTMDDINVHGQLCLWRPDFNSPISDEYREIKHEIEEAFYEGNLEDYSKLDASKFFETTFRIDESLKTLNELRERGAKTVVWFHQGKCKRSDKDFTTSAPHILYLKEKLDIEYTSDCIDSMYVRDKIRKMENGDIIILNNSRLLSEELLKGPVEDISKLGLSKLINKRTDIFIPDCFGAAHRSYSSIVGAIPNEITAAGRVIEREYAVFKQIKENPRKLANGGEVVICFGGRKSDKFEAAKRMLETNSENIDKIIFTGLLATLGVYSSTEEWTKIFKTKSNKKVLEDAYEKDLDDIIKGFQGLEHIAEVKEKNLILPKDFALDVNGERIEINHKSKELDYPIKDIGTESANKFGKIIENAGLVVINGPPGCYEDIAFAEGGKIMFSYLKDVKGKIVLCGGNTIPIIEQLGIKKIYHKSTGGGAATLFLGAEPLPLIAALENRTYIKNSLKLAKAKNILTDYGKERWSQRGLF